MTRSMFSKLVGKDLYFNRWLIVLGIVGGLASIWIMGANDVVGFIVFVTIVTICAIFIGLVGQTKERTEHTALFVLSLPISTMQYTAAKVVAACIAYLSVWGTLLAAALLLSPLVPTPSDGGEIRYFVAMLTLLLTNFFVLLAVGLIATSELAVAAAIILTNLAVPLFFARSDSSDQVTGEAASPLAAGWTPGFLAAFAAEGAIILFCLGLIFYTQSRRRDFV